MLLVRSYEPVRSCVTALCSSSLYTHNSTLAHRRVSSSSVVRASRSQRVVGSNPIWDSDFSESTYYYNFIISDVNITNICLVDTVNEVILFYHKIFIYHINNNRTPRTEMPTVKLEVLCQTILIFFRQQCQILCK